MPLLRNWPLYASVAVLLLLVWLILSISISHNHGYLAYSLDDAYIHTAMAKNFSQFGVWGVTRYGFTPTSSSLLWMLLLSLTYYLGGVNQLAPLVWNLLFAVLVLAAAHHILSWYHTPPRPRFLTLLGIIVLVPLPLLIHSGMEQTLQTLVTMLAVFLTARLASSESPGTARRDSMALLPLAPLLIAVRFEGMFLVAIVCGVFLLGKRGRYALAFAACGFLPMLAHGGISVSQGWVWFPASVLLKATLPDFRSPLGFVLSLLNPIYVCLRESLHVLVLLISLLIVYIMAAGKGRGPRESRQVMGAVLALAALAHLEFVGAAPLYRYDAWWCALAILFLGVQFPRHRAAGARAAISIRMGSASEPRARRPRAAALFPAGHEGRTPPLGYSPMHRRYLRPAVPNGLVRSPLLPELHRGAE